MVARLPPVSYTHLDVYKRQGYLWFRGGSWRFRGGGGLILRLHNRDDGYRACLCFRRRRGSFWCLYRGWRWSRRGRAPCRLCLRLRPSLCFRLPLRLGLQNWLPWLREGPLRFLLPQELRLVDRAVNVICCMALATINAAKLGLVCHSAGLS